MREINFRAWDTKTKKFIVGIPPKSYMLDSDEWDHHDCEEDPCFYPHYVFEHYGLEGRILFQQYTGLKDSKGKEIYEGDLIKYTKDSYDKIGPGKVEFIAGMFVCSWNDQTDSELGYMMIDNMEVVGNIYENPELVEE